MGQLIIDKEKCKKDGICVGECPIAILTLENGNGWPEFVPGGEKMCIACGHCVAVCPHGAFSHDRVRLEDCPDIDKDLTIDENQAVQFLRSRRSIRSFKNEIPDKATLKRLIEIARYAPTASNAQTLVWTVLTDRAKVKELAKMTVDWIRTNLENNAGPFPAYMPAVVGAWDMGFDAVLRKAPVVVVASAPEENSSGMVDLTLALSYFELAAPLVRLGTCWAGLLQGAIISSAEIKSAIGLPEGHIHHFPMMVGYPKSRYFRLPEREKPKIHWKE